MVISLLPLSAVAEAERLLAKGEIMQDTAVLTEVINTLDNPVGRVIAKDELEKHTT